jgi:protein MpaA
MICSPLGMNRGGYFGEVIPIDDVLQQISSVAERTGWTRESIPGPEGRSLTVLGRRAESSAPRVYVSAGIHGDEPAGPCAILKLLEEERLPSGVDYHLLPCLNPVGFLANQRGNPQGIDLNRDFRHPLSPEVRSHVRWLEGQPPYDLTLCLHEDWEARGFYLYELNPDQRVSRAAGIIRAVETVCPIDPSPVIEGREASGGIIRPHLDPAMRPQWPEAFYLIQYKTRLSYTLEAPSDYPLPVRVEALTRAVVAASQCVLKDQA